jgi:hypothetical protein
MSTTCLVLWTDVAREVALKDVVVALPSDEALRTEIARQARFRSAGFWLSVVGALLFFSLMFFTYGMVHYQKNATTVEARIVAVEHDANRNETLMTSEFVDADGEVHRDTQTSGYHYARGEPEVGQAISYLYWRSDLTGEFGSTPRGDGILKWLFGCAGAVLTLMAIITFVYVNRHRRLRLRLIASGRRERGAGYAIESRTVTIPLKVTHVIHQWRLNASYFENSQSGFKNCHSDWQPGLPPDRLDDLTVPVILVDVADPRRYWLPVGELYERRPK